MCSSLIAFGLERQGRQACAALLLLLLHCLCEKDSTLSSLCYLAQARLLPSIRISRPLEVIIIGPWQTGQLEQTSGWRQSIHLAS